MTAQGKIPRPVSYQDVIDAPDDQVAEIVNGVFYLQAKPAPAHAEVTGALGEILRPAFQRGRGGPGGWWIVPEPELQFADRDYRTLVPDLAGWRRERLPVLPQRWSDLNAAPDWACEILSPSTGRLDRVEKMPIYAEEGVAHLWLVDPAEKTLEAYKLTDKGWLLGGAYGDDGEVAIAPFDAVPFPLSDLWMQEPGADTHAH